MKGFEDMISLTVGPPVLHSGQRAGQAELLRVDMCQRRTQNQHDSGTGTPDLMMTVIKVF